MLILSDLHGCYYTMLRLLTKCPKDEEIVLLGDLIDRGPHSRQVVEWAMKHKIPTVMGNHEHLALQWHGRAKSEVCEEGVWAFNGGLEALKSWHGGKLPKDRRNWVLPDDVLDWMEALPWSLDFDGGRLSVSHTGHLTVRNGEPEEMRLWWRDTEFPKDGRFRVFGHSQRVEAEITPDWAAIDTGAAYADRGYGVLTAFQWPSRKVYQQEYCEDPL